MPLHSPAFWDKPASAIATALLPFAALYQLGYRVRRRITKPVTIRPKILCIGNLIAGGAGKTPVALAIGEYIKAKGIKACFLSKGYGGKITEPTMVDSTIHSAADAGDEPLLLARILPTIIAQNRVEGARYAEKCGFELVILDDGFQNPTLTPDISLIVVDAAYGFGNGHTLPSGPLREPPAYGLARADAVLLLHRNRSRNTPPINASIPVIVGDLVTICPPESAKQNLVAFSGIARPQQFFDALTQHCQANLATSHAFADHHPFSDGDLRYLRENAHKHNARLITTAKDAVRLPKAMQDEVLIAEAQINWHNADALADILSPLFAKKEA